DCESGAVLERVTEEYPLSMPKPGWVEQDAHDFSGAAMTALKSLSRRLGSRLGSVRSIGLTGQMHSAALLDESNATVRPTILWCDTRTSVECRSIASTLGEAGLRRTVGNLALEGFTLPKLLWVRTHEPEAFARVRHVLMPKDYVGFTLTGVLGTDDSD